MRPERRLKPGMDGGLRAAVLVSPPHYLRTAEFLSKRWGPPQFSSVDLCSSRIRCVQPRRCGASKSIRPRTRESEGELGSALQDPVESLLKDRVECRTANVGTSSSGKLEAVAKFSHSLSQLKECIGDGEFAELRQETELARLHADNARMILELYRSEHSC